MQQVHPSKYYPDRKHIRLEGYDYSTHGCYFVTVVVQNRLDLFGEVINGELVLNEAGQMVSDVYNSVCQRHDSIQSLNLVVMPNHIHSIMSFQEDDKVNLSSLMQQFKSETTWRYCKGVEEKGWQRFEAKLWQGRFYDHIIRCNAAYEKINEYIYLNPMRWDKDKLNKRCDDNPDDINAIIKQYEIFP